MITTQKREHGFYDEKISNCLVRAYANTQASGYVSALNLTPTDVQYSDILNVDLVLSQYPTIIAGRFEFDYSKTSKRIARRNRPGVGKFAHIHLMADPDSINLLLSRFGKKVFIDGDEIAIERGGKCWFWQTTDALDYLCIDKNHELTKIVREAERVAQYINETACHSIAVQYISDGCEICAGSGMSGHFAAGATGMMGYGGSIAQNSLKKARESGKESFKNSEAGKNKEAKARLDMENRVKNLRNQQK